MRNHQARLLQALQSTKLRLRPTLATKHHVSARQKNGSSPYKIRLCRVVAGNENVKLWNNEWVKSEYASNLSCNSIVDEEVLKNITPVIVFRETRIYND